MSETPRRKRFQIHLSTAVVMMIAAGGMIWANTRLAHIEKIGEVYSMEVPTHLKADVPYEEEVWMGTVHSVYGWPNEALRLSIELGPTLDGRIVAQGPQSKGWQPNGIVFNALTALGILFAVWFVCEWWIRRRASRGAV